MVVFARPSARGISWGVTQPAPHMCSRHASRFHYTFNLRDISKVFQGFLMITAPRCTTVDTAVRLWAHECSRVFYDRLINREDQQWFEDLVVELLPRYLKVCKTTDRVIAARVLVGCRYLPAAKRCRLFALLTPPLIPGSTNGPGSRACFLSKERLYDRWLEDLIFHEKPSPSTSTRPVYRFCVRPG